MTTYYLNSGAGGGATGADWTNAFLTFTAALAAATTIGDVIKVHKAHTEELGTTDTTYTFGASIAVICVDKDASDALAVMGTSAWIGSSSSSLTITLAASSKRTYMYGLTFRNASNASDDIRFSTDGHHCVAEACYLWLGTTNGSGSIALGSQDANTFIHLRDTTIRFGATAHALKIIGKVLMEGCTLASAGTAPTTLMTFAFGNDPGGSTGEFVGCDFSYVGSGTLVGDSTTQAATARFSQCKLGSGYVAIATQTHLSRASIDVYINDCASGDTHGLFGHHNPMGSTVSDTGIYFTAGAAAQSWKIVTTANCSLYTPYESPWFGYYNTGTSAITPYVEILRDGSTTAYQDDEVWMDIAAKVTTTSTIATLYSDRMTLLGTAANQDAGAGLGSWTGEGGTAWSGKLALGSSITPAENGHIQARIVVGEPSITVYADPQIRT